ncbi:hypothetical protein RIF29_21430 [Crotalaria pallida]|uniref:Transmembrane protein n=1 Tax=Crotalaria pallida TaxID=3830 RepID=A0AAN9F2Z7_CROPI
MLHRPMTKARELLLFLLIFFEFGAACLFGNKRAAVVVAHNMMRNEFVRVDSRSGKVNNRGLMVAKDGEGFVAVAVGCEDMVDKNVVMMVVDLAIVGKKSIVVGIMRFGFGMMDNKEMMVVGGMDMRHSLTSLSLSLSPTHYSQHKPLSSSSSSSS